jgi:adenylate kinase
MNIVLFGAPGAGKGAQAERIASLYGMVHLSTGEMLRSAISSGSDLGVRAKDIIDRGELISDDIIVRIVDTRIDEDDCVTGVILDGFPRTIAQAEALNEMLAKRGRALDHVIEIEVDELALFARIENRASERRRTGTARSDDNAEILRKRLAIYRETSAPLLPYYRAKGLLRSVDGMISIEGVATQIDNLLR